MSNLFDIKGYSEDFLKSWHKTTTEEIKSLREKIDFNIGIKRAIEAELKSRCLKIT
jgi:hypothetical protein